MAIKSNNPFKKILSNFVPDADEIMGNTRGLHKKNMNNMVNNYKNTKSGIEKEILDASDPDVMKNIKDTKTSFRYSKGYDDNYDTVRGIIGDDVSNARNHYQTNRDTLNKINGREGSKFENARQDVSNYFFGDGVSHDKRMARLGTAAVGSIAGIGIGARYLSGGTATTNRSGNRDIVGVPLI